MAKMIKSKKKSKMTNKIIMKVKISKTIMKVQKVKLFLPVKLLYNNSSNKIKIIKILDLIQKQA